MGTKSADSALAMEFLGLELNELKSDDLKWGDLASDCLVSALRPAWAPTLPAAQFAGAPAEPAAEERRTGRPKRGLQPESYQTSRVKPEAFHLTPCVCEPAIDSPDQPCAAVYAAGRWKRKTVPVPSADSKSTEP